MSRLKFDTIDLNSVASPASGSYLVAYDLDGKLKQKDSEGVITEIGGNGGQKKYKSYVAKLNQSGINPPTDVILENDFEITPVWSVDPGGDYSILTSDEFIFEKTVVFVNSGNGTLIANAWRSPFGNFIYLKVTDQDGTVNNDWENFSIEVRTYQDNV